MPHFSQSLREVGILVPSSALGTFLFGAAALTRECEFCENCLVLAYTRVREGTDLAEPAPSHVKLAHAAVSGKRTPKKNSKRIGEQG
jgi:hypothetical protein